MKYSIRGKLNITDVDILIPLINTYEIWKLDPGTPTADGELRVIEIWLNSESAKTSLFNALKPYVDEHGEEITWHECTHDEPVHTPCVIAETYRGE